MILQTRIQLDSTTRLSKYKYIGTQKSIETNSQSMQMAWRVLVVRQELTKSPWDCSGSEQEQPSNLPPH